MTRRKPKPRWRKDPPVKQEKVFRAQAFDSSVAYTEGIPVPERVLDLIEGYSLHPWVYAGLNQIASNYASIDYEIFRMQGDELIPDLKHPFNRILQKPNPFMTFLDVKEFTSISLESLGSAYWGLERNSPGGEIQELWPLPPQNVEAVSSKDQLVSHYNLDVSGKRVRYNLDEIIHIKYASPLSFIYGQGSLQAVRNAIVTDMLAEKWNQVFFRNSGRPDAVLEVEGSLSPADRKRTLTAWRQLYSGVQNSRKVALLENKTQYKPVQQSHADMEFMELRKQAREQVLASIGVPPSIVGILEFANYSNVKEQKEMFWKYTMMPKIRKTESVLTMRVNQLYFRKDLVIKANLGGVEALREDEEKRSKFVRNYWDMGVPLNNLIDTFSLPFEHVEGGDEPKPVGSPFNPAYPQTPPEKSLPAPTRKAEEPAPKPAAPAARKKIDLDMVWKRFDRHLSQKETQMEVKTRAFFRRQRKRVLDAVEKNVDTLLGNQVPKAAAGDFDFSIIFNEEQERKHMRNAVRRTVETTYLDFAVEMSRDIDSNFDFNLKDPRAQAWIDKKVTKLVTETNRFTLESISENTKEAIEDALAEGFDRSETIKQIEDRIEDVYDFAVEGRAERIARTEIISASNAGRKQGMEETGVQTKKWVATRDDKTRDTHAELGAVEPIPIGEDFITSSGAQLDFPGDPDAPPEEVINCRCTVVSGDGL